MPLNTTLADEIELRSGKSVGAKRLLIYFIPGNPGLVEYYRRYLEHLQKSLQDRSEEVIIYGASHDGFEFHKPTQRINQGSPPFSLQQEIHCVRSRLSLKARQLATDGKAVDVILVGHSVGSYILLESVKWWQNQHEEQSIYSIKAGICLFPTVVDIVKSDKGQSLRLVLNFPGMGYLLCAVAAWLNWFGLLGLLTTFLTPGPQGGAITAAMAKSDYGIRQVIYMARDELATIKEDKWHAQHLWGVEREANGDPQNKPQRDGRETTSSTATEPGPPRVKLYFLFGKEDYWVNNDSRDSLISARSSSHTTMEILHDRPEIPHTFSLHPEHSDHVAEKSAAWIATLEKD